MSCRACKSANQHTFGSEINLHFPGRNGLDKPTLMVFPHLLVCFDCGFAEFEMPEKELWLLSLLGEVQTIRTQRRQDLRA
jgi:hypothetical protein